MKVLVRKFDQKIAIIDGCTGAIDKILLKNYSLLFSVTGEIQTSICYGKTSGIEQGYHWNINKE